MTSIATLLRALWFVLRQPRIATREAITDYGGCHDAAGIPVVTLRGTPYQRGFQHGYQCAVTLQRLRQAAWRYAPRAAHARLGLPPWLAPVVTKPLLLVLAATYVPKLPDDVRAEIQGLADGSGLPLRELLVNTVIWELFAMQPGSQRAPLHCSEIALAATRTADLGPLLGYNYDVMVADDRAVVDGFLALFVVEPAHATAYITPNTIGSVGLNTAMNRHGVAFGWDNSYLRSGGTSPRAAMPFMLVLREVALQATSLQAAAARLQREVRPQADICVLADHDHVGVVELAGQQSAVRTGDAVWSCNRLQALVSWDYLGAGRAVDGRHTRYPALVERLPTAATVADVAAILRDQGAASGRQIATANNAFTVVYAPRQQRLWLSIAGPVAACNTLHAFDAKGQYDSHAAVPPAPEAVEQTLGGGDGAGGGARGLVGSP